jgi:hypothetical protein
VMSGTARDVYLTESAAALGDQTAVSCEKKSEAVCNADPELGPLCAFGMGMLGECKSKEQARDPEGDTNALGLRPNVHASEVGGKRGLLMHAFR